MQLRALLANVPTRAVRGPLDVEIRSVCFDSRQAGPGALFVALPGERVDGNDFLRQAFSRGAAAAVFDRAGISESGAGTWVEVANARLALADLAANFYHHPSRKLKVAGITGTNGKTTTSYLLKHLCERARLPCGLIGTVRYEIGSEILPSARTTPESLELQGLLAQMRDAGCRAAVMEVSSHALSMERAWGVQFDAAVWTNLTQDHLDYHQDMAAYFEAKARLFTDLLPSQPKKRGVSVVNIDDRYGAQLLDRLAKDAPLLTYGVGLRADFRASNFKIEPAGTSYQLDAQDRSFLVRLPLIGKFNIYNSLAAVAAASAMGITVREAVLALATAPPVPGRLQPVPGKRGFQVYVDYAHTPDALANVLRTLRDLRPNRLIAVFGCGGDRDRNKRPLMGRTVEGLADYAIVTSDNPRSEEPAAILQDIERGFSGKNYEILVDREEAIWRAVDLAEPRDIVVIAGKGHETYQEFAARTVPFDDVQVAQAAMNARPADY